MTNAKEYAVEINEVVVSIKSSTSKLFELMKDATSELGDGSYKTMKSRIDVDHRTVFYIEKIIGNAAVMNNISTLPMSWIILNELQKIDEDILQSAIDLGAINVSTSLNQVRGFQKALTNKILARMETDTPLQEKYNEQNEQL